MVVASNILGGLDRSNGIAYSLRRELYGPLVIWASTKTKLCPTMKFLSLCCAKTSDANSSLSDPSKSTKMMLFL